MVITHIKPPKAHLCTKSTLTRMPSGEHAEKSVTGSSLIKMLFLFLIVSATVSAQSYEKIQKKADGYFSRFNYEKALALYSKMEEQDIAKYYVTRKIADCYRMLNAPAKAAEWYGKAAAYPDVDAETCYHLALMLRVLERYSDSEKYMQRFYTLTKTQGTRRGLSLHEYLVNIRSDSVGTSVHNMEFNTPSSEFGSALINNELVFSSNRPARTVIESRDARSSHSFFRLYTVPVNSTDGGKNAGVFQARLKSKYNDGPVCFSSDGNTMYVTRNTVTDVGGRVDLDIATTRKRSGKWDKIFSPLPFKAKGYSIAHPSISHDDERLYFVSDMPGGYGGMDIYYSERKAGFLSQPVNLGPHINTPGNELFPSITADGRLFFASNGHSGLGGLDIFVVLPTVGAGFSDPVNLGQGINSPYDDFGIIFNSDGQSGYFSSNRPGGRGDDDIYAFTITRPLLFTQIDCSIINRATKQPETDIQVYVTKRDGTPVASFQSGSENQFTLLLRRDEYYSITLRKRLMETVEKTVTPEQMAGYSKINIAVEMSSR